MKIQRRILTGMGPLLALFFSSPLISGAGAQDLLLPDHAEWSYLHPLNGVSPAGNDSDFDLTWMLPEGYDGPAFSTGKPGAFSYGGISYFIQNGITGTLIGAGADGNTAPPSGLRYTAYFRTTFTASEFYARGLATMLADDGAVVYMDGVEVARVNMTGTGAVPENAVGDFYEMLADDPNDTEVAPLLLVNLGPITAGTHTLAVSIHNTDVTSSDLGFSMSLQGFKPVILRTDFGGVFTEIGRGEDYTGWTARSPGAWRLNGPDDSPHDIQSAPVDLSSVGEAWFSMELYCHETSTGSNFEETDTLDAKLLAVRDDNTTLQIPLLPASLDANGDGLLGGEELNPGHAPVEAYVTFGRQLTAVIPADVKSVSLLVTGRNDSASEFFALGGALISDQPPGTDADGDGRSRESELQSGTDPDDSASVLTVSSVSVELNPLT